MNSMSPHPTFEQLRTAKIKSLDIDVLEFRHKKTGTIHLHLATDNPENVFLVGLRTIPQDSTGVAHILEHTVLCGSENYPVRDPFFMMIRRSLNTFMNAFTSSDWTAYPFASQNQKDFFNLLDVYLDAVFFSRIHELDFMQEGHRVEFETPDDPSTDLVYKGVVFNEMKGAMSAPTSVLWQTLSKHLFPNNTYHFNSGGDPEVIPELSYQELVDFYKTHYHPSNAVFMTFGNIPAPKLQERFEEKVLQRFDALDQNIHVEPAHRIHSPMRVEEAYALDDTQGADKTHIVLSFLLGESIDLDQRLQAHLLSNVLLDNSSSPLMQALEKTDLGTAPSPLCGVEDSNLEMVFACGVDGSRPERANDVEALILDVLEDVASNGVAAEDVEAVLHQLELSQREIRGDGMPFGLQLILSGLSAAMQRGDAIAAIDLDPALERLREAAKDKGFIPSLVRKLLLDNPHRVRLTLRPDESISERRLAAEKQRLVDLKSSLDEEKIQSIVTKARELAERQEQEDDPDILPKVTLADVPPSMSICTGSEQQLGDFKLTQYAQGTNGIVYQHAIMELPKLSDELMPYLPMYTSFLSELGSGGRDYLQTQALQAQVTGGLGAYVMRRGKRDDEQDVSGYMVMRGKALLRNSTALSSLMQESLQTVRFDEHARIRELVAQSRAHREQSITGSGHALAMTAASSGMSPIARISHQMSGLAGIQSLKKLDDQLNDDKAIAELCNKLELIHAEMKELPMQFMIVGEEENLEAVRNGLQNCFGAIDTTGFSPEKPTAVREQEKQLWQTSTEVNFCSKSYPTVPSAHKDSAPLAVLGSFLRNGFLHRHIRETGGAYGGGATYDSDSASFRFFSYRDPRLTETLDDFDQSIQWLLNEKHGEQELEEAILNVVSSIDKPASPAGEARNAFHSELFGRTAEIRQAYRRSILEVQVKDLQRVGENYLKADKASTAVITNAKSAAEPEVQKLGLNDHFL